MEEFPQIDVTDKSPPVNMWQPSPQRPYVDSLLNRGVVFSIIWILGFGSIYAVYLAMKARKLIAESEGQITGMGRVYWCFIVGGIGVALWAVVFVSVWLNG